MLTSLIGITIILGAITGFVDFSERAFLGEIGGQIAHGVLIMACFTLVGAAFWFFGWKIGLIDLLLVIIASNVALTVHRYCSKKSGW